MKEVLLTKEGYKELEERLEYLKTVQRPEVSNKIRIARGFGDLSENAEYDAAKDEQAQIESKIAQIEEQLKYAKIIEETKSKKNGKETVQIGSTVKLLDLEYNDELEYKIVGTIEANPREGKISNESPIGDAIIGYKKGDVVNVTAPAGVFQYKILEIL